MAGGQCLTSTNSSSTSSRVEKQHKLQSTRLQDPTLPLLQVSLAEGYPPFLAVPKPSDVKDSIVMTVGLAVPWSRGSVHIKSAFPSDTTDIDPSHLSHPLHLELLALANQYSRKLTTTRPLSAIIQRQVFPPQNASTEEDFKKHTREMLATFFHPSEHVRYYA